MVKQIEMLGKLGIIGAEQHSITQDLSCTHSMIHHSTICTRGNWLYNQ